MSMTGIGFDDYAARRRDDDAKAADDQLTPSRAASRIERLCFV
jgi:hypothetical protein